jgi:hypothetical protein
MSRSCFLRGRSRCRCLRVGAVFVLRQAADDVAALLDRLVHQLGGARVAYDALLRESDDLDGGVILHLLACQQQAARGFQPPIVPTSQNSRKRLFRF